MAHLTSKTNPIRLDSEAVTFVWSGSETDYSGMLHAIMDDLADLVDAVTP